MCICVDDDFTTALIFKCFIENGEFEYPYLKKYLFRSFVSIVFDSFILTIVALSIFYINIIKGLNDYSISHTRMYISLSFISVGLLIHFT